MPVIDDVLAAWLPPAPGMFLVRLTAADRAGNVRAVSSHQDTVPVLANLTQTEFLISPNGDGVKDAVTIDYLVLQPTNVDVRVVGPITATTAKAPPTLRAFHFDYPDLGPQSFIWDGRDTTGQVVADGKYTVLVNDVPLRVEVDATPPDIAWAYDNLRVATTKGPVCGVPNQDKAALVADRLLAHRRSPPQGVVSLGTTLVGTWQQVYEPQRGGDGEIVLENGIPKVGVVGGHAASAVNVAAASARRTEAAVRGRGYAGN